MLIEVALTENIINQSMPIHYRYASKKARLFVYVPLLIVLLAVAFNLISHSDSKEDMMLYTCFIVLAIGILGYSYWSMYIRSNAGKHMIKLLGDRTHYEIEVTQDGLITRLNDATYDQKWTVYPKAIISKQLILLYQQNNSFAMFHHSFFANDDFDRFKELVRDRVHQVIED